MINELILAGVSFFHPHAHLDSLGVETVNGKIFVIHKVDEKETLYAIARRYGASVAEIVSANPGLTTTLEVGQVIKVPYVSKSQPRKESAAATVHKVAAKETMYSISRQYGVSVDEIRKWNNLTDNNISIGQELIVRKPASGAVAVATEQRKTDLVKVPASGTHTVATKETLFSISRQYGVSVGDIRAWNNLSSDELQVGQTILVAAPANAAQTTAQNPVVVERKTTPAEPAETPVKTAPATERTEPPVRKNEQASTSSTPPQTIRISESLKNSDEITEAGIAEMIDGTEGNRKYLALHRTAPVGTILKVRNEMNNREVFVRVMGKLPDTANNDKVIIKISRSAYDRLGAIDPKFRVELTYYK